MHRAWSLAGGVMGLVLKLWVGSSWGGPPNPTPGDPLGNTAGGSGTSQIPTSGDNHIYVGNHGHAYLLDLVLSTISQAVIQ